MGKQYWAPGRAPGGTADDPTIGVLLVNLGTPEAPTASAVRRYLGQFLHDWRVVDVSRWLWCPILHGIILPLRSPRVARNYAAIWGEGGSPLMAFSRSLSQRVDAALGGHVVQLAMTYGAPSVGTALRAMAERGIGRVLVLPLYPQYSATTTGAVFDAVARELMTWRDLPELRFVRDYHRDPAWVQAMADSIRAHWQAQGRGERLLFSFHGIPQRFAKAGDPYPQQCQASAEAIAAALGLATGDWALTFQSRFGREPWLRPYTDVTLREWGSAGLASVDVVCPGFAVDCLETLEEIAVENRDAFIAAGGRSLNYVAALNDGDAHVAAMQAVIARHTAGWNDNAQPIDA